MPLECPAGPFLDVCTRDDERIAAIVIEDLSRGRKRPIALERKNR
jgi:hypothetical protein